MRNQIVRHFLAGLVFAALPITSFAFVSVGISVNIAPPELPVYVQPPCPAVGYIWTPGYWAYGDGDYYWVPGTWVMAPEPGLLWTPGYWGWGSSAYIWHAGYWGPHVGFYGGVDYGYGYGGVGFQGGYWRGGAFYYNRSVANLGGIHATHVYNRTVINNITVNRVSYNGGRGGINSRPTGRDLRAEHEHHVEVTSSQREHEHMAFTNHDLRASVNGGRPRIAATERPAMFSGRGVVSARAAGGPVHGADTHTNRMDRPPSAAGGAAHGTPRGLDRGGPDRGSLNHGGSDHAGPQHSGSDRAGPDHGGAGHVTQMRTDRPPQHESAGTARGPEVRTAPLRTAPPRVEHNERPPMQHASPERAAPHPQNAPHLQIAPAPQNASHLQNYPRPQSAPQPQSASHLQRAPQPQSAPHLQRAPQPQEPRPVGPGQSRSQSHGQPPGRGEQDGNHGRR
ncbi:MAG: hypothetical protein ACREVV_16800 [Steroidobacteraceae bacterium]